MKPLLPITAAAELPPRCTCTGEARGQSMFNLTVRADLPGATLDAHVPRAPALDLCSGRLATTDAQ
jgi:hypothetical protein